ncbi:MAG: oligoendopeptidase F [Synergistetes bacterium HGW-Synergistetes-1]|nr:MAG: oligoendopeptidase F [Synergistetes bacterium HGW-Synergistetes-1]
MSDINDKNIEIELGGGSLLPKRDEVPVRFKWKLEDIYPDDSKWEKDFKSVKKRLPEIASYMGRLGGSEMIMLECLKLRDEISITLGKLIVYANMKSHEDTADSKYQGPVNRVSSLAVEMSAVSSFITPEILSMPEDRLRTFIADPSLKDYCFSLKELLRQKEHVLSQSEEALLAKTGDMAGTSDNVFSMLTNADMKFESIRNEKGEKVEMSEERAVSYLRSRRRSVRKAAFESLYRPYCNTKNALGATFDGMLKTSKFYAEVRKYSSPLEAELDSDNIPLSVYSRLVETLESSLTPLHRYLEVRKRVLRVKELHMYDLYTPLVKDPFKEIPWGEAKEMMFRALRPLGDEYLSIVKEGLESGWTDVFPNKGKRSGAYSWGSYATHPYIMMNYTNNLNDVSTLVHEMGHSMHSYYSRKRQPYPTSDYCIFTAEVASTTNEVLFLNDLIAETKDKKKRLYLLNRRLENIRTTVYRQTMFASFEREVHKRAAEGGETTPDALQALWYELNRKYYGPDIVIDEPLKMEWARIPHFYNPFYVYQYATGFSAATALALLISEKGAAARDKYLEFLSMGGSDYPIELLKKAGVDMSSPKPIKEVVRIFTETLDEMEKLL